MTTTRERPSRNQQRRKTPSFSSSLLDAIYHSIDEPEDKKSSGLLHTRKKNNAVEIEEEFSSLRRAMMIEKWMENYTTRRVDSYSTDSTFFSSSSETELSSSKSSSVQKDEGSFMRTKSRTLLKIYGDLKKVKQPISPGCAKIANFLNSIFNSRNNIIMKKKKKHQDWDSVRKSRSMKDSSTTPSSSSRTANKSSTKRSVIFCPVSVIVDDPILTTMPNISSHYIKKNIDSFRYEEEMNPKKHKYRGFDNDDDDDDSCTSSDLFELDNIGMVGREANREELPVYGTTSLKIINQAIARGLMV